MKRICKFCQLPFPEDDMIAIRLIEFDVLNDPEREFYRYAIEEAEKLVPVCEPCYFKRSKIKKEKDPPSLLRLRFPSIKLLEKESYRSKPYVNMGDDMVKITFVCKRHDWKRMKFEFGGE